MESIGQNCGKPGAAPRERRTDVDLKINGKVFQCERRLLALESAYFQTMFESEFCEKTKTTIEIGEIDDSAFEEIFNFMYGLRVDVTPSNVLPLMRAIDFLQLRSGYMENRCYQHLATADYAIPNAAEILLFCLATKKEHFSDLLIGHIRERISHYVSDDAILELPFEVFRASLPAPYKEYDGEDRRPLYVTGNATLKLIMSWINHSREDRCKHRTELMSHLLSADVSKDYALALLTQSEKIVDAAMSVAGGVESLASPNQLVYPSYSDAEFVTGTTLLLTIFPFSSMKTNFSEHAAAFIVNGVTWTLSARRVNEHVLFTFSSNRNFSERCYFKASLTVASLKEGVDDISICVKERLNLDGDVSISFPKTRFEFDYLSNEENGYSKDDVLIVKGCVSI